jgi:hypothetical protein
MAMQPPMAEQHPMAAQPPMAVQPPMATVSAPATVPVALAPRPASDAQLADDRGAVCTAPQLRRFIKSRAYVPLHELRRRFELNGTEDDVSPVVVDGHRLFVGLPPREASLLGELLRGGEVGYELLLDPASPLIVGVFPMRPVPRS